MKHIENTSIYKAEEGCFIVRKSDGSIMGKIIDLSSIDSINNYTEEPYTIESYKEFCSQNKIGVGKNIKDNEINVAKINHYPILHTDGNIALPPISNNSNVSIVTTFSDKGNAVLVSLLEDNGIDYINAANGVENFVKAYKPVYYYKSLESVKTEYVLILDSYDSIIKSLSDIENLLALYGKTIIYGSWYFHYPQSFYVDFGVPEDNKRKFLNSGTLFGKTDDIKAFYKALSEYINANYNADNSPFKVMEQYWIYKFLSENSIWLNKVGIDYNEVIVKNMEGKKDEN